MNSSSLQGSSSPSRRLAHAVTAVTTPVNVAAALLVLVALDSTGGTAGLAWGGVAALFAAAIPLAFIRRGVRHGDWSDHHVREREKRRMPLLVALASVVVGLVVLFAWSAPRELLALVAAMLVGLAVTLGVTHWWKVSIHTAVFSGAVVILVLVFGPVLFVTWPLIGLVGWSRVSVGDHTSGQVAGGAALGALVAAVVFSLLR